MKQPTQAEALTQAGAIQHWAQYDNGLRGNDMRAAAQCLRALHAELESLRASQQAQRVELDVHPDDAAVDRFAIAMKSKLAEARAKGRGGWECSECSQVRLSDMLREHVEKGDPRDVANFCMFLWCRGESIAAPAQQAAPAGDAAQMERDRICAAIKAEDDYCVDQGDYMLDSDDCIKIVRGEWVRPEFLGRAAIATQQP